MAILSVNDYIAASKKMYPIDIATNRASVANIWFSLDGLATNNGTATLAGSSTTTGAVPTDATAGYPTIRDFDAGAIGYVTNVTYGSTVACRIALYDLLWKGGAYAFNANTTGNSPTSYASRVPDTDYNGLELWYEQVTASTGAPSITVNYLDQDNNTASTGAVSLGASHIVGRMFQLPLAAGDSGLRGVTGVVATGATAGTFNILVMRKLWETKIMASNGGGSHGLDMTGMPIVFQDSCLKVIVAADSTSTGVPSVAVTIANK